MKKNLLRALLGISVATTAGFTVVSLSGCVPVVAGGIGAGILMAEDRRTSGTYLMDEEIELKTSSRIRENFGENTRVSTTSFNRQVMLTGQVPNAEVSAKVEEIALAVPNVRMVQNELSVGAVSGFTTRTNDGFITTKVKARFLDDERFSAHHVKVVTENSTVYLMGMVKREEGNAAAEVAARTAGVSKVVKVFEYMD
jgi:osmotically-inducible protein OsmY